MSYASNQLTTITFNASGTWTAPGGVSSVLLMGFGGGGGASSGISNLGIYTTVNYPYVVGGGSGGAGSSLSTVVVPVTPGTSYIVTIGSGGIGGTPSIVGTNGYGQSGTSGGSTRFGTLAEFPGAGGGYGDTDSGYFLSGGGLSDGYTPGANNGFVTVPNGTYAISILNTSPQAVLIGYQISPQWAMGGYGCFSRTGSALATTDYATNGVSNTVTLGSAISYLGGFAGGNGSASGTHCGGSGGAGGGAGPNGNGANGANGPNSTGNSIGVAGNNGSNAAANSGSGGGGGSAPASGTSSSQLGGNGGNGGSGQLTICY